jgi:hypothetical protein
MGFGNELPMFTPLKIYNGTPLAKQSVPLEIQGQQLPINELNGTPLSGACPISNLHRCKYPSAFDLYLGEVDFENYGDLADNEEHTVENRLEEQDNLIMDYYKDDEEEEGEESENEYYPDEDDFGECLKIGCGKASATYSAYCAHHAEMYDK